MARLAGLPETLLQRAEIILNDLESDTAAPPLAAEKTAQSLSESLFTDLLTERLLSVDVATMTPIEAISFLYSLQKEAKEGSGMK